jgi:hypothetical protein
MGGKKLIGSAAPANKRSASAVKLRLTPASTFWKQYDPRLPLQELPHILAVWLRSPSPWRLSLTGLYLPKSSPQEESVQMADFHEQRSRAGR